MTPEDRAEGERPDWTACKSSIAMRLFWHQLYSESSELLRSYCKQPMQAPRLEGDVSLEARE